MTTSTDPVSPEQAPRTIRTLSAGEPASVFIDDGRTDLYAESELRRRQERTERMIRLAEEQQA